MIGVGGSSSLDDDVLVVGRSLGHLVGCTLLG